MTLPGQVDVVERHLADALASGGRPVLRRARLGARPVRRAGRAGGRARGELGGARGDVRAGGDGHPGAVAGRRRCGWPTPRRTRSGRRCSPSGARAGMRAARALRAGMTSVNSVISFAAVPALPFGGSGESGFGRIHGADGLREFSRAKSITRQRMKPLVRTTTFSRDATRHGPDREAGHRAARPPVPAQAAAPLSGAGRKRLEGARGRWQRPLPLGPLSSRIFAKPVGRLLSMSELKLQTYRPSAVIVCCLR